VNFTSPLQEITYHMGSYSVTCHPVEVTFPPLPQPKLVLDLATPKRCKAELSVELVGRCLNDVTIVASTTFCVTVCSSS